jgi:hypothetical protein
MNTADKPVNFLSANISIVRTKRTNMASTQVVVVAVVVVVVVIAVDWARVA